MGIGHTDMAPLTTRESEEMEREVGKLDGRVAFITGAARGMGRSHALVLASEGADIIGVDICAQVPTVRYPMGTEEELEETVRLVEKTGRQMVACTADVRDRGQLRSALEEGQRRFGRLDIVLANAGISNTQLAPYERSEEAWNDNLAVNLTGVWNTLQVTTPALIEGERGGAIVITSSAAGTRVVTTNFDGGFDGYTASKHAIVGLMKSYAGRLARHSIRVNTIHPTTTATGMARSESGLRWAKEETEIIMTYNQALPVASLDPVDISNGILYLVSDDGRYVTGQTLHVDAGNTTVAAVGVPGVGAGGVKVAVQRISTEDDPFAG